MTIASFMSKMLENGSKRVEGKEVLFAQTSHAWTAAEVGVAIPMFPFSFNTVFPQQMRVEPTKDYQEAVKALAKAIEENKALRS